MKAICDGRSTKYQVVQESLEMYREVYVMTTQRMDVLKTVSGLPSPPRCLKSLTRSLGIPEILAWRARIAIIEP